MEQASMPLIWVQAFASVFLAGLIWTIQVVHYPLFAKVGAEAFPAYEMDHMRRIGWIVGPVMILELFSGVMLVWLAPAGVRVWMVWAGLALLAVIWLSTALVQGPMHVKLAARYDEALVQKLVGTNWVRTIAWSARAVLALMMVAGALRR